MSGVIVIPTPKASMPSVSAVVALWKHALPDYDTLLVPDIQFNTYDNILQLIRHGRMTGQPVVIVAHASVIPWCKAEIVASLPSEGHFRAMLPAGGIGIMLNFGDTQQPEDAALVAKFKASDTPSRSAAGQALGLVELAPMEYVLTVPVAHPVAYNALHRCSLIYGRSPPAFNAATASDEPDRTLFLEELTQHHKTIFSDEYKT